MPRKVRLGTLFRRGATAGMAGAAWLGLGLVVADENPARVLGLVAAVLALAGGCASRAAVRPALLRALACLLPVLLARLAAGPLAAILAAGCLAAGWWLRVRASDAVLVLALFGGGVAALSTPSWRLLVAFALLGALTVGVRPALALAVRGLRRITFGRHDPRASTPGHIPQEADEPRSVLPSPPADTRPLLGDER